MREFKQVKNKNIMKRKEWKKWRTGNENESPGRQSNTKIMKRKDKKKWRTGNENERVQGSNKTQT